MLTSGINSQTNDIPPELSRFRTNKTIPAILEKNVLTALSFYPELTDTSIHFVFKQAIKSSVMQAQPVFSSLLASRNKRAYRINISALFKLTHTAIPIHQLPDAIMIGWIGHELGHIMDYESRTNLEMVGFGLGYVFSAAYVKKVERIADQYAVTHGLGQYLIHTKRFILDHAELPQAYKDKIARLYVSPEEITEQVRTLEEQKLEMQKRAL
ncbi:hypothetical protein [Spirosoma radiotolerans]|uniref:Peptidase M48 domain-containing protein n=1 Tax=Spirosoma radiotolerans TaxID=1379870 RepID=A0A0E3ZUX9_9BACT|nr:hypothetical protein [Spirosoma radiotolerans]AKD55510.1 hypothetical protein SD10_11960 [Spirosoma radiotolerans]